MSEDKIERHVEKVTDQIDLDYMAGRLSEAEYKAKLDELATWAECEFSRSRS